MKLIFGGLVSLLAAPPGAATTIPCPPAGSITTLPPSLTSVTLPIVSNTKGLCILLRRATGSKDRRAALARSYGNTGSWERSPGLFAQTDSGVVVTCVSGQTTCDVTLPALNEDGLEYVLESYEHETTAEGRAARFLEQATFGPTLDEINDLTASGNGFEAWVEAQLALPASSHREFYRRRTNPKYEMPFRVGAVGPRPCELYSRWRKYAITSRDRLDGRKTNWFKHLVVTLENGKYIWRVDGHFRTATSELPVVLNDKTFVVGESYRIWTTNGEAWKHDCVGCPVHLQTAEGETKVANPAISFEGVSASTIGYGIVSLPPFKSSELPAIESPMDYPLWAEWIHEDEHALLNTTSLESSGQCNGFPTFRQPFILNNRVEEVINGTVVLKSPPGTFPTVFGRTSDGEEFAYDPHLALYENSLDNPAQDGGGQLVIDTQDLVAGTSVTCQNVDRTFLNEDHCAISYLPNACAFNQQAKHVVVLSEANIAGMNSMGLSLTVVTDQPFSSHQPCALASTSRWIRDETDSVCANSANLGATTLKTYSDLITGKNMNAESDYNGDVVDVFRKWRKCDTEDKAKTDLGKVPALGVCWKHVHPTERNVMAGTTVIGRLGDHVELDGNEPAPLDGQNVHDSFGKYELNPSLGAVLVCGSPGEVASDPFYGDRGFDVVQPQGTGYRTLSIWELSAQRHTTWTELTMHADDALRQKMAWSLSQIVSVGLSGSGMVFNEETEHYMAFYDIFVRNAFGSYLDILKEISHSVIMGSWLSFINNKSLQYNLDVFEQDAFPDENFAREIMQLFSIGLYELNMDGTHALRPDGTSKETYDIADILSYSRAWTGFVRPEGQRGGVSTAARQWNDAAIDPMRYDLEYHDLFPKTNVQDGYIGWDRPLCEDLPSKHFLRKGASFIALGSSPQPSMHEDDDKWHINPDYLRLRLLPSSPLYHQLCAPGSDGECTFPSKVTLNSNLVYGEVDKLGDEYKVDTIRTVELSAGLSNPIYYEYIRQPCVELAFFTGKKLSKGQIFPTGGGVMEPMICGNPKLEAGTTACMFSGWEEGQLNAQGAIYCHYHGERMTYASAEDVCTEYGLELGHPGVFKEPRAGTCADGMKYHWFRSWSNASCHVQVKISFASGDIGIVHKPQPDWAGGTALESLVMDNTMNMFKAYWTDQAYPTLNDCLAVSGCSVYDSDHCICDTETFTHAVFTSSSKVTSIDDLMSGLSHGAVDPSAFDSYTLLGSCGIDGVQVYALTDDDCSSLGQDTVFQFEHLSKLYTLKNQKSMVRVPLSSFSFQNPVHFLSLADPETYQMSAEIDAVLDSLFYHPSHAPFMASRLLQRFGISNPSPDMNERVAEAYKTGSFGSIGTGVYGDLSSTVAAILLDSESRLEVLDADPGHGQLREPLIKALSFFKSMGLSFESPLHWPSLLKTEGRIGQGSYEIKSVFSFFLPEYVPSVNSVQAAGLVVPESMVLSKDNTIDLLESLFVTVRFGIRQCGDDNSFEEYRTRSPFECTLDEGDTSLSMAKPSYWPTDVSSVDAVLDELDLLLTSKRLGSKNRALIKSIVEPVFLGGDIARAVRMSQQLTLASPEFHSTGVTLNTNQLRELSGYETIHPAPYKALVILNMVGGADSWNMLVPLSGCPTDQYSEYQAARGNHALSTGELITINAQTSGQDCTTYGLINRFDHLAELYQSKEAIFFANAGLLSKPLTKNDEWLTEIPFQLFAHNTMQHEMQRGDPYDRMPNTGVLGRILDQLKLQGFHTSANSCGDGGLMLTGDPKHQNPVNGVSTKAPSPLNKKPTAGLENLYEIVKELNGVGSPENSVMSETWSSRVATSLFEHETMDLIQSNPDFDITSYGDEDSSGSLSSSFKAILEFMKSRNYRKVNREIYVLKQTGYDHHGSNGVGDLFSTADDAIKNFVTGLKDLGLWESTALMMVSDFGRSMNRNSNDGSDHAWGGNYFILGGSVNGGKILGTFPRPVSENDQWIKRGRFIPSTPWEAMWSGIAQWMGVHDKASLGEAMPNRASFDECQHLFTDKDLFTDGACSCVNSAMQCEGQTFPPTGNPTDNPTGNPSNPTAQPSKNPVTASTTSLPSAKPSTLNTTGSPSSPIPNAVQTNNIFEKGSLHTNIGCTSEWSGTNSYVIDGTTEKWYCTKEGVPGFQVEPLHDQMSIPQRLRVYSHNNCPNCDAVAFILKGRKSATSPWEIVKQGPLEWENGYTRNSRGSPVVSTYDSPDEALTYTEVDLNNPGVAYLHYQLTFPELRDSSTTIVQMSEVELVGLVLTGNAPTETFQPTAKPVTESPTANPTDVPTAKPVTQAPVTASPTITVAGVPMNSILDSLASITVASGGIQDNVNVKKRAVDKTTEKFYCGRRGSDPVVLDLVPSHGKLSIVKALRVYTHNNCPNCDGVDYKLEGRESVGGVWHLIDQGEFAWKYAAMNRNARGLPVSSTFEAGDSNLHFTEVDLSSNNAGYLHYRLTFLATRNPTSVLQFSEVELPGLLF